MNFFTRLFRRAPASVPAPPIAATTPVAPPAAAPPQPQPTAFPPPPPDDITLIDPISRDAWRVGAPNASPKKADGKGKVGGS